VYQPKLHLLDVEPQDLRVFKLNVKHCEGTCQYRFLLGW